MTGRGVRVVTDESTGDPWFVAADVCRCLWRTNPTGAIKSLAPDERAMKFMAPLWDANTISESGLYKLILRAHPDRHPTVRKFQDWVTRDVLPRAAEVEPRMPLVSIA